MTDEDLLRRAVQGAHDKFRRGKHPRWTAIMHTFAIGRANAYELCRRFDLDPDEMIK